MQLCVLMRWEPISKCARYFINQALSYKMKHKSKHKNDLLFVKDNGECISYTTAYECIKDACYHIQRPDISPHGLRHMFLTIEARHGDSLTSIKLSAGHSLGRNTIERYLHKNNESRVEAANKKQIYLERILYGYVSSSYVIPSKVLPCHLPSCFIFTAQTHKIVRIWGNNPAWASNSSSASVHKIEISYYIIWEKF